MSITSELVAQYRREGYLLLPSLLSDQAISRLLATFDHTVATSPRAKPFFAREAKDIARDDQDAQDILRSPELGNLMLRLTGRALLATQCIGFELRTGYTGLPWHLGVGSFNFILPETFACSLWIPLNIPIHPRAQGGGVSVIPRTSASGQGEYAHVFDQARLKHSNVLYDIQRWQHVDAYPAHEPTMQIGDAFLFDKDLYHRSVPLRKGQHESRWAFVIRFIDAEARFARAQYVMACRAGG